MPSSSDWLVFCLSVAASAAGGPSEVIWNKIKAVKQNKGKLESIKVFFWPGPQWARATCCLVHFFSDEATGPHRDEDEDDVVIIWRSAAVAPAHHM